MSGSMDGRRVLVIGSGAREHALCWRLATDGVEGVFAAPGNALMTDYAEVRSEVGLDNHDGLIAHALAERVDLVIVGPEAPLVTGLADKMVAAGIPCFGPSAAAARLEGSKAFAREVCRESGVRMAAGAAFERVDGALAYAESLGAPVVVKADGLAAGKGVAICESLFEAESHIRDAIEGGAFGAAGRVVVVEEYLIGVEASVIAICDGEDAVILPAARDHKRLLDGDAGPNTGGMGAFSPVTELDDAALLGLRAGVFRPVLAEMRRRGTPFRGALFAGLMLTSDGPRVLEFNCRFGDPETQAILPRLGVPLLPLLLAAAFGRLPAGRHLVESTRGATIALTLAAQGYPQAPRSRDPIDGIEEARTRGALVFGAGVRGDELGRLVTSGGRVLTVVGRGADVGEAADAAYEAAEMISFDGQQMRRDVGRPLAGALT
jgi:phosphoribosylamine--glycine ligase